MHVLRGRIDDPELDAAVTTHLLDRVMATERPAIRVWRPPRQLSFGRRDANAASYGEARDLAREHGFPPIERSVGGGPVAFSGSAVAIALATPNAERGGEIDRRYDLAAGATQRALWRLGVPAQRGEPPDSFCPGARSLRSNGKIAGFGQRVKRDVALTAGVLLVSEHEAVRTVLTPVYGALSTPFDPSTVSSIVAAGGRADPGAVTETIESILTDVVRESAEFAGQDGESTTVTNVRDLAVARPANREG